MSITLTLCKTPYFRGRLIKIAISHIVFLGFGVATERAQFGVHGLVKTKCSIDEVLQLLTNYGLYLSSFTGSISSNGDLAGNWQNEDDPSDLHGTWTASY